MAATMHPNPPWTMRRLLSGVSLPTDVQHLLLERDPAALTLLGRLDDDVTDALLAQTHLLPADRAVGLLGRLAAERLLDEPACERIVARERRKSVLRFVAERSRSRKVWSALASRKLDGDLALRLFDHDEADLADLKLKLLEDGPRRLTRPDRRVRQAALSWLAASPHVSEAAVVRNAHTLFERHADAPTALVALALRPTLRAAVAAGELTYDRYLQVVASRMEGDDGVGTVADAPLAGGRLTDPATWHAAVTIAFVLEHPDRHGAELVERMARHLRCNTRPTECAAPGWCAWHGDDRRLHVYGPLLGALAARFAPLLDVLEPMPDPTPKPTVTPTQPGLFGEQARPAAARLTDRSVNADLLDLPAEAFSLSAGNAQVRDVREPHRQFVLDQACRQLDGDSLLTWLRLMTAAPHGPTPVRDLISAVAMC